MDQALLFEQFDTIDAFRRMQGDFLASLGFGPVESSYRAILSAPYCAIMAPLISHVRRSSWLRPLSGPTFGT